MSHNDAFNGALPIVTDRDARRYLETFTTPRLRDILQGGEIDGTLQRTRQLVSIANQIVTERRSSLPPR